MFRDVNGKEIARQQRRANHYGSFAGTLTAPRDRVLGQMSIRAEGRASGEAFISVEEYKRPKFEVSLNPPRTASKLNENVRLVGRAVSYTGAAIGGALVQYHVTRQVQWPSWSDWRAAQGHEVIQQIAHGTVQTENDGSFTIEFVPLPDRRIQEKYEPSFHFLIDAYVTDTSGESGSTECSFRVGYVALESWLSANEWQTAGEPVEIEVSTRTLDNEPQAANGTVRVYTLQIPRNVERGPLPSARFDFAWRQPDQENAKDLSNPNNWPLGPVAAEKAFDSDTNGTAKLSFNLSPGAYRVILETQDRFGKKVSGRLPLQVLSPNDEKLAIKVPHLLAAPTWEVQPGETFMALWGTGYDEGRAFMEIEHRNRILQRFWTTPGRTQQAVAVPITEEMRGGFTVRVTQIRENRAYLETRVVKVPWKNKDLAIKWEHFTSKLQPGQRESWTAAITGLKAEKAAAEIVATLYDESLDQFRPHHWLHGFDFFRNEESAGESEFANAERNFNTVLDEWDEFEFPEKITYRHFPNALVHELAGFGPNEVRTTGLSAFAMMPAASPSSPITIPSTRQPLNSPLSLASHAKEAEEPNSAFVRSDQVRAPKPDVNQVTARKNLNETAFFFPQLTSDSNGVVRITFTPPEALTKWRFMGFAHDRSVRSGYLEAHAVTSKDLMVQPNPPRFLREEDTVEFTVKVSNQSDIPQTGTARLNFKFALNEAEADSALGNTKPDQDFEIAPRESRSFAWRIHVPDGCGFLTYKAVAATATLSDGEEGAVPVLSRRVLVTESGHHEIDPGTQRLQRGNGNVLA